MRGTVNKINVIRLETLPVQYLRKNLIAKRIEKPTNAVPDREAIKVAITKTISLENNFSLLSVSNHINDKYERK